METQNQSRQTGHRLLRVPGSKDCKQQASGDRWPSSFCISDCHVSTSISPTAALAVAAAVAAARALAVAVAAAAAVLAAEGGAGPARIDRQ